MGAASRRTEAAMKRKGEPNEVQFSGTETPSFVNDYGLDDVEAALTASRKDPMTVKAVVRPGE